MEKSSSGSGVHVAYISIIVVLLVVMAGGFFYLQKHNQQYQVMGAKTNNAMMPMPSGMPQYGGKGGKGGMPGMMMVQVTPPAVSDQQNQQLTDGVSTTSTQKTFNITGGNFYFVPNKITVNKGDQVTFVMTNAGGVHDLVIDELGVKTPVIHTGEAATATFTASKTGTFTYYCDIQGHKAKGMWGTLTVQ